MYSEKINISFFNRLLFLLTGEDSFICDAIRIEKAKSYRLGKFVGIKIATEKAIRSVDELAKYNVKSRQSSRGDRSLEVYIAYKIDNFEEL